VVRRTAILDINAPPDASFFSERIRGEKRPRNAGASTRQRCKRERRRSGSWQGDDGDSNEISGYVLFPLLPPPPCPRDVENGSPRHSRTGGRAARRGAVQVMTNRASSKMDLTCETGMSQVTPALTKARAQPPFLSRRKKRNYRERRSARLSGMLESVPGRKGARALKGPVAFSHPVFPFCIPRRCSPRGSTAVDARRLLP